MKKPITEIVRGMTYTRYMKKGTGPGKWQIGDRSVSEFVVRQEVRRKGETEYVDISRRMIEVTIVAITQRISRQYKDLWYKVDLSPGFGYWTTNVHRITRYLPRVVME
jgi:ribosomal protein L16/L10AE